MYCDKCGKEIDDVSKFCKYCGNEIGKDYKKKSLKQLLNALLIKFKSFKIFQKSFYLEHKKCLL